MEPITDAGDQKNGNSGTGSMLVNFFEAHNVRSSSRDTR